MKTKIFSFFVLSVLLLAGCQSKGAANSKLTTVPPSKGTVSTQATKADTNTKDGNSAVVAPKNNNKSITADLKAATPGTIPQLSQNQKSNLKSQVDSAFSSINDSLNSLDDVKDLDLSSVN